MALSSIKPETFREKHNLLLAGLSELSAPLLRMAARRNAIPAPPQSWRRGVIMGADHIGDVLYNTASLPALATAFPDCEWNFLATPPASEVLKGNPYVKSCVSSLASLDPIDVAICYNSGGYWRDLILATRAGIPNRVGYVHKGFSALVTHPIRIDYPKPYPAYFRDLVAQLTGQSPAWSSRPQIYPSSSDMEKADRAWSGAGLGKKPVVVCFLTSRQASGVWPSRNFAEVVSLLERSGSCQTVLCGTADDAPLLQNLKTEFSLQSVTLTGELDLLSLGSFLQKCAVVLCPDSGPRHLANAVRTPVVFVRNLAVGKIETGAYLESEIDLAPDFERLPRAEQPSAFSLLTPAAVTTQIMQMLELQTSGTANGSSS